MTGLLNKRVSLTQWRNGLFCSEGIKTLLLKKRAVSSNSERKRLLDSFMLLLLCCLPFSNNCQSLWLLLFYYLHELLRLLMLFITVTCFTLCSIKPWCAAAVELVHSVCAGPVVFTGMTCTIIDICFKGKRRKLITKSDRTCHNDNKTNYSNIKTIYV